MSAPDGTEMAELHLDVLRRIRDDHAGVLNDHVPNFEKRALDEEIAALDYAMRTIAAGLDVPPADWLWGRLMDFCLKRRFPPAEFNDLFAIVAEARAIAPNRTGAA